MYTKVQKWFGISVLYDNKRDILLNGMILSGTHCSTIEIISLTFFAIDHIITQLLSHDCNLMSYESDEINE